MIKKRWERETIVEEHQPSDDKQPFSPQKKRRTWRGFVWAILFIMLGGALGIGLYVANSLQPTEPSDESVRVSIPSGIGSNQIAKLLEEHGIIRDAMIFRYYLVVKKQGDRFQAGDYDLTPGMTLDQIILVLNRGETVKTEVMRFTIPEGFTVQQIAERLEVMGLADANAFLALANEPEAWKGMSASQIPDDSRIRHRLEGYLFPETYELKKESTEADIIGVMLEELDKKLAALPADWQEQLNALGLSLHELLTVASLIEREVVLDEERPIVAGVIYNRLKRGQMLQIDATVQYSLDKPKERLYEKDLQVESPYNTYRYNGLPPGPIASPSLASIRAALYPAETPYYYYVTKKDGSQGHLFAETFEQHRRNIAESQKNR